MSSALKFQNAFLTKVNPSNLQRWSIRGLIGIGGSVTSANATLLLEEVQTRLALQLQRYATV